MENRNISREKHLKQLKSFKKYKSKISLPIKVIVSNSNYKKRRVCSLKSIKNKEIIGGFVLSKDLSLKISNCNKRDKILLSGTPSNVDKKIYEPTNSISRYLKKMGKNLFILGGDSANDLKFTNNANISSGGGAALSYLALNSLEVIDKLKSKIK